MISFKDYAAQRNVTYEAVRQQVHRYNKELDGHINKVNRTQYLDDFAVDFLDEKRKDNPVAAKELDQAEKIEYLESQIKLLLANENAYLKEIADLHKEAKENAKLIAEAESQKLLLEEKNKLFEDQRVLIDTMKIENEKSKKEIEKLEMEKERASNDLRDIEVEKEKYKLEADELHRQKEKLESENHALKNRGLVARVLNRF